MKLCACHDCARFVAPLWDSACNAANCQELSDHQATILKATIVPADASMGRYQAVLMAELDNGSIVDVFSYYSDELSFSPRTFLGHTLDSARTIKHRADVAYLQS